MLTTVKDNSDDFLVAIVGWSITIVFLKFLSLFLSLVGISPEIDCRKNSFFFCDKNGPVDYVRVTDQAVKRSTILRRSINERNVHIFVFFRVGANNPDNLSVHEF